MNLHANARMTSAGRLLLCQRVLKEEWSVSAAAEALGISRATAYKWLWRYESEGEAGLEDRSSTPHRVWNRTSRALERRVEKLRRRKLIAWAIAKQLRMALSDRSTQVGWLNVDPVFDRLRDDPGFTDLLRDMDFPGN